MSYFLFDSVKKNNFAKLKKILEKGKKSPNVTDSTPLHFSAWQGHLEICKYLVEKGADVNASNKKWKKTPLILAAYAGKADVVEFLIGKGSDINAKDESDWTALHFASQEGHEECCTVLLRAKADLTIRNNEGKTAREVAEENVIPIFDNPPSAGSAPAPVAEPEPEPEPEPVAAPTKPSRPKPAVTRPPARPKKQVTKPAKVSAPVAPAQHVGGGGGAVVSVDIKKDLDGMVEIIKSELGMFTNQIISNIAGKIDGIEIPEPSSGGGGGGDSEEIARLVSQKMNVLIQANEADKTKLREEIEELRDEKMELEGKLKELKERLAGIISDI